VKDAHKPPNMKPSLPALTLTAALFTGTVAAQTTFQAFLSGTGENPPNASPATGFGTVVLNAAQTQITLDLSFSGLIAPATASHIHGPGGVGTNAAVIFPFTGVPAATSGSIPEQIFAITPTQVTRSDPTNTAFTALRPGRDRTDSTGRTVSSFWVEPNGLSHPVTAPPRRRWLPLARGFCSQE
jgi:hypothetical protein